MLKDAGVAYGGVNTNVRIHDGYMFEIRLHTTEGLATKEPKHKLYEEQGTTKDKARYEELKRMMAGEADKMPTPPGIGSIR